MSSVPRASHEFEVDVFELHSRREAGEDVFVVDVRETKEFAIATIGGVTELPTSIFEAKWKSVLEGREEDEIIFM